MRDVSLLRKHIGSPYRQRDEDGMALGCMKPIYLLYPDIPRYPWPKGKDCSDKFLELVQKHGQYIDQEFMQPGDVLVFRLPCRWRHAGVYMGGGDFMHCDRNAGMELVKLYSYQFSVEGVYRWQSGLAQGVQS